MQTGKYAEFRDENENLLQQCKDTSDCEVALFNLGFVHAYPRSPYRNSATALRYFDELVKKYPTSPWAYQGRMWVALIRENLALAEKRRQLQGSLRSSDAERRTLRDQLDRSRQIDLEMEQKERELLR
jgi:hypothetical protein